MKNLFVLICCLTAGLSSRAQTTANVYITLDNTKKMRVENYSFFNKPANYTLHKKDETHYVLQYTGVIPGLVFLNYRPVYITPGDSIALTHKMFFQTMDVTSDTLMAKGKNAANYMFSNLIRGRALDKYFPDFKEAKYKHNVTLFYIQLCKEEERYNNYFDNLLNTTGCSPALIAYLKRAKRNQLLFNLIYSKMK